jgi:hypothetical protein
MPHPDLSTLRELQPIDDDSAAAAVSSETHAELLDAVIANPVDQTSRRPWTPRWSRRPLLLATALAAIVAILLVVTPGLLSGGDSATQPQSAQAAILHRIVAAFTPRPGTVVIEKLTQRSRSAPDAPTTALATNSLTTITETSADGIDQQDDASSSLAPGYEQVEARDVVELYDPANRTIYSTSGRALNLQTATQTPATVGKDAHVTVGRVFRYDTGYLPGNTGRKRFGIHILKLAGRTTVDGQRALKLVAQGQLVVMSPETGAYQIIRTLYLDPRSYAPIKQVATIPGGATLVTTWSLYRVLPATAANRRLVSLKARHPQARVVRSAAAYMRVLALAVRR